MTSTNPNVLDNQGEFHAKVHPAQRHGGPWHKPGNEQGNAAVPEFHAQQYPPGTAPKEHTFQPNATNETPQQGNPVDYPNLTSKDVHNAHNFESGRPMEGQTSREVRGAHAGTNKKERSGLEGVGSSG
ncbi:hypothetical protein GE09DRAFT_1113247 [Coniochaeta sp. 2T2.1]|nr:hypothetical protein GE09DRAFT_1113247 [Coniochaeta sp. 2T2.1]